ncbi:MAG: copper ion binding protein [Thermodesulfovibrionales bacterium]
MTDITIRIDGMSCGHCVMRVKKAVEGIEGVAGADVKIGLAKVRFDEDRVKREDIEKAITEAGYKAVG